MRRFRLSFVMLVLFVSIGWAQPRLQMAVDFSVGFPQGEFADNVMNTGYGMDFQVCYRMGQSPVSIGGSLGFLTYGKETREEPFSDTVPDLLLTVDTTNNILLGDVLVRYQPGPSTRAVRPYIEGVIGFNYLWTQTSIRNSDDDISSTNYNDTALSVGPGGGVFLRLHQGAFVGAEPAYSIDLNVGVRYLFGGEARYLKEGSIIRDNGSVLYVPSKSNTNLLLTDFGIVFSF